MNETSLIKFIYYTIKSCRVYKQSYLDNNRYTPTSLPHELTLTVKFTGTTY